MRYYAIAAGLARLADEMVAVALVLLALGRTGSAATAGALITAYTLPTLVSGPVLGAWLDRTRHRRAALTANLAVLAGAAVGLVALLGRAPVAVAVTLAALTGVTLPMTSAGYTSLLPRLLLPARLPRGYVLDATTFNVAAIAGPALAGGAAAMAGPAVAVLVLAATAGAGLLATAVLPLPVAPPQPDRARDQGPGREPGPEPAPAAGGASLTGTVRAGLRHLLREPVLRGATLTTVLSSASVGVLAVGMPLYARHLGARDSLTGLLWAALEVGSLLGTLSLARLRPRWTPQLVVVAGTAACGAVVAAWPLARSVTAAVLLVVAAGLASGPVLPSILLVRQRQTPPALLAQISTTGASLKIGAYAVGAALGGALAPRLGAAVALGAVAGTQLAAAALGWLAGVRAHRLPGRDARPSRGPKTRSASASASGAGRTPWMPGSTSTRITTPRPPRRGPRIGRQPHR